VGERYHETRLLALGENPSECGEPGGTDRLVRAALPELRKGRRRIHLGEPTVRGTLVYHRLGSYAAALTEARSGGEVEWGEDGFPKPGCVAQTYDLLAFTSQVKCSPNGAPTLAMWETCGPRVLARELDVLAPRIVLVLGCGDNAWHFVRSCLGGRVDWSAERGEVRAGTGLLGDGSVEVFVVPHPAAHGGASRRICDDLRVLAGERLGAEARGREGAPLG
jgi:hypothetical protein